jgi:hypothetical protein
MDRLAALEMFVRVVDTGSFSAVARSQEIGQPAVSKAGPPRQHQSTLICLVCRTVHGRHEFGFAGARTRAYSKRSRRGWRRERP